MTLNEMQRRLLEELNRADAVAPAAERLVEILNSAKDRLAIEMESLDSDLFTTRASFSVAAGDTTITLPSDFVRLIGLTRTDTTRPIDLEIVDSRERYLRDYTDAVLLDWWNNQVGSAPVGYLEGGYIYFVNAPQVAMTLLLRYRKRLADLTVSDGSSSYSDIPAQWHFLVVDIAAEHAVPAKSEEYRKIVSRVNQGRSMIATALSQRVDDSPRYIRRVPW